MPRNLFLYTIVAALGGFLFGFDTAVINGALPFFRDHFQLDKVMEGWAMSSAIFGCIVGAIGIGRPGDRYGRRYMLKIVALDIFSQFSRYLPLSAFSFSKNTLLKPKENHWKSWKKIL